MQGEAVWAVQAAGVALPLPHGGRPQAPLLPGRGTPTEDQQHCRTRSRQSHQTHHYYLYFKMRAVDTYSFSLLNPGKITTEKKSKNAWNLVRIVIFVKRPSEFGPAFWFLLLNIPYCCFQPLQTLYKVIFHKVLKSGFGSGSVLRKTAGSVSARYECGSTPPAVSELSERRMKHFAACLVRMSCCILKSVLSLLWFFSHIFDSWYIAHFARGFFVLFLLNGFCVLCDCFSHPGLPWIG